MDVLEHPLQVRNLVAGIVTRFSEGSSGVATCHPPRLVVNSTTSHSLSKALRRRCGGSAKAKVTR